MLVKNNNNLLSVRLPIKKIIPKSKFSDTKINRQFQIINELIDKYNFSPKIIIGHWENPQLPLLTKFKHEYNAITALVFHNIVYSKQKKYFSWAKKHINNIDVIGARSEAISKEVQETFNLADKPFICYSGIPERYLSNSVNFEMKKTNSFLYVGRLIKRKNIDVSIKTLYEVFKDNDFEFNIVGSGAEKYSLLQVTKELNLVNNIQFLGYKEREEVIKIMDDTEVFIMISENETFGLVYLEAMARGCIVIASKNGGMDGIIRNGYNGFLCEQGSVVDLKLICEEINNMSPDKKKIISKNAQQTASHFTDSKVADRYLKTVLQTENNN
jgi:L-malate glycosyltransferase